MQTAYLIFALCSGALCAFLGTLRAEDRRLPCLALLLGGLLGVLCARLTYFIFQLGGMLAEGWLHALFSASDTYWSFWGGCAGGVLGLVLSCRLLKAPAAPSLNTAAPWLALLSALLRGGFWLLTDAMERLGEALEEPIPLLTVQNAWGENYLVLFTIEALCCLLAFAFSLRAPEENRFLRTALALSLPQVFLSLLRGDSYYLWFFLNVEHLLWALTVLGMLIFCGVRRRFADHPWRPLWVAVGCFTVVGICEYLLDKYDTLISRIFPDYYAGAYEAAGMADKLPRLFYLLIIAALLALGWTVHAAFRKSEKRTARS